MRCARPALRPRTGWRLTWREPTADVEKTRCGPASTSGTEHGGSDNATVAGGAAQVFPALARSCRSSLAQRGDCLAIQTGRTMVATHRSGPVEKRSTPSSPICSSVCIQPRAPRRYCDESSTGAIAAGSPLGPNEAQWNRESCTIVVSGWSRGSSCSTGWKCWNRGGFRKHWRSWSPA